ncbi:MAG: type VI secretion system protein TssA [Myxococcales bacterium FL481]|nr:MAG: type VI secretion system protein TssA [Myxococcales bacterium FL481]
MDLAVPSAHVEWVDALAAPLSGDPPTGTDAKYELEHEEIREQVGRLESLSGEDVDWKRVAELAQQILSQTSKDLLVASYLARAEFEREGLDGLARGLELLATLMERYWDQLFPAVTRMRGRVSALGWLLTQCEQLLPDLVVDEQHREPLARLDRAAAGFAATTRDKYGEHAPATRPLTDAVARLKLSLPEPTSSPSPAGPSPTAPPRPTTPSAPSAATPPPAPSPVDPEAGSTAAPPAVEAFRPKDAAAVWLDPIPGPSPAGADSQYEPDHEAVQAEIGKLETVTSDPVDWNRVATLSDQLIRSTSKHLSLATYLARARFELEGIPGLTVGLALIAELTDAFWEAMHPPLRRIRRRSNAMTWLLEGVCDRVADTPLQAGDERMVDDLEQATNRLAAVVRERFDGDGPAVRPLLDTVKRLKLSVPAPKPTAPEPQPDPQPEAKPTTPQAKATPPTAAAKPAGVNMPDAPTASVGTADEAVAFLRKQGQSMLTAANVLRSADPANPLGYRLLRTGLFIHLETAPPATAGKTQIPPTPPATKERLELMATNGKWEALLEESEALCRQFRFNLNLHRISAQALQQLGRSAAAEALAAELGAVLARMPDLPTYQASDGSPLADEATRDWLETSVLAGSGETAAASVPAAEDDRVAIAKQQAQALKKDGKVDDAIAVLQGLIMQSAAGRDRFCARMALADFALASSQPKLGLGLYGALASELAASGIGRWEPRLAAQCLANLVKARRAHGRDAKAIAAEPDDRWQQLCELDPALAQQLVP